MYVNHVKNVRKLLYDCTYRVFERINSKVKLSLAEDEGARRIEPARKAWAEKQRSDAGALAASRQVYWLK